MKENAEQTGSMKMTIWDDEKRSIKIVGSSLIFCPKVSGKSEISIPVDRYEEATKLSSKCLAAIARAGGIPSEYYAITFPYGGPGLQIAAPICAREAIRDGVARAISAEKAADIEARRIADLRENVERRAIDELFCRAERLEHSGSDDNVSGPIQMRCAASARLVAWAIRYPRAAAMEQAGNLESRAAHEESLAAGALTYDADGWLSREEQNKRSAEFSAKAATLRAEAAKIRGENK